MNILLNRRNTLKGKNKPKPNEIFYWAPEQITLAVSTNVASHTFSNGKGVITLTNNLSTFYSWFNGKSTVTKIECNWDLVTGFDSYCFINTTNLVQDIYVPNATGALRWFAHGSGITSFDAPKITTTSNRTTPNPYGIFAFCPNLKKVNLPKLKYDHTNTVYLVEGCRKLEELNIDWEHTTHIADDFAYNSTLNQDIIIPNCIAMKLYSFMSTDIKSIIARKLNSGVDGVGGSRQNGMFRNCTKLKYAEFAVLPRMYTYMFYNCPSLETLIIDRVTPPTFGDSVFSNSLNLTIYVPDEAVDTYKAASGWSSYASKIKPISELPE